MMTNPVGSTPVLIPLLNPNEPESRLVLLAVTQGEYIQKGDPICTLETTKSTAELLAEADGYVCELRFQVGDMVTAGEIFCYLAGTPDWIPPDFSTSYLPAGTPHSGSASLANLPNGLRITKPALERARLAGLDLNRLPVGPLITERMIQEMHDKITAPVSEPEYSPTALVIVGGGGHGKTLIELIRAGGAYEIAGIVDDGIPAGEVILGMEVLGGNDVLPSLHRSGLHLAVNAIGGISNPGVRLRVFEQLAQYGFDCPAVVHPSAVIEPSAVLADGVQVFAHAYVGSQTSLGFGVIANTGVVISHDCQIGEFANLSPGGLLAGGVQVGERAMLGMGITVNLGVKIGRNARIGNGATIKADVPAGGIVRAGSVWPA